jgi:phosphate:Na+ symporter
VVVEHVGVLALVAVGLVMTALMQSSTAAIAVTLSAHYAGAVGLDQACALIIGQNIGTATSSAMAAIGASTTAKRLALAYVLFKLIAGLIALALFPFLTPLLVRAASTIDGVTLLAAYHTAYNVVGVAVLLPLMDKFTRFVERLLPERSSPLTRCLDPSALVTPVVAVEAVRRTIARALIAICEAVDAALDASRRGEAVPAVLPLSEAGDALRKAQVFMSDVQGPPETEDEQRRLTCTLHALDDASRLAETARQEGDFQRANCGTDDALAAQLCVAALRDAALVAASIAEETGAAAPIGVPGKAPASADTPTDETLLIELERRVKALSALAQTHRSSTLSAVATGVLTTDEAIARVDTVRRLEALADHAWRSAAQLVGRDV